MTVVYRNVVVRNRSFPVFLVAYRNVMVRNRENPIAAVPYRTTGYPSRWNPHYSAILQSRSGLWYGTESHNRRIQDSVPQAYGFMHGPAWQNIDKTDYLRRYIISSHTYPLSL